LVEKEWKRGRGKRGRREGIYRRRVSARRNGARSFHLPA
jgi:hypothetical protein